MRKRVFSLAAALLLVWCVAAPVAANPIEIVSGTFVLYGYNFNRAAFSLAGSDGSTISGGWPFGISQAASACRSCPGGTAVGPGASFEFGVPFYYGDPFAGGTAVLDGKTYSVLFGGALTFGGPTTTIAPMQVQSWEGTHVSYTLPFELTGVLNGYELFGYREAQLRFTQELAGRGTATLEFLADGPIGGPARFDFLRTTYRFEPVATPEPQALLLMASGIAAIAASRIRRRR